MTDETKIEEDINIDEETSSYETLVTRAASYEKASPVHSTPQTGKLSNRGKKFFLCKQHYEESKKWLWVPTISRGCTSCIKYETRESLGNGLLPTGKEVLEFLLTLRSQNTGKRINNSYECSVQLVLQWIYCNVYPHTIAGVKRCIEKMDEAYTALKKSSSRKKISDKHWSDYAAFIKVQQGLFDIRASNARNTYQENLWGLKMSDADNIFYQNQKLLPRVGYSTAYVDRKWKISNERRIKRANRSRNETYEYDTVESNINEWDEEGPYTDTDVEEYEPLSPEKSKYAYVEELDDDDDPLPSKYRHPRDGLRSVRPELYALSHYLSSSLHMSHEQVEGSIVAVANMLFGRRWKVYASDEHGTDNNTLPSMNNTIRTERYMEAMALNSIVEEIMQEDSVSCVVYSNDGSSQSITGNYVVQSLTVNGVQRSLPTFGIFSETKQNLKDLSVTTLDILSAATGRKYSPKEILQRISFTMTDSTAHNIGVMDMVCEELDVEEIPPQLLCNVHPLMLFQSKIKDLCQQIHDHLGKEKIKECFLVDIDFQSESFVIKALKCLSNFINKEYSSKPWNRSQHFSDFIKPKQNMSISLKDHRFNRLNDCALTVLHHIDDIDSYLETFTTITNGVAILDRGFMEIEILKPIFVAIALLGLHITRPFHGLLMDENTVYSTLLTAFPKIYDEMISISPGEVLTTTSQVFFFVTKDIFQKSKPPPILLETLQSHINLYANEVTVLVRILLKMFADGFDYQKGAIFGFGKSATKETDRNVVKICDMEEDEIAVLDKNVQVHNIGEERNVGMINYELSIRGKGNLDSVSRKLVLNRSADLVQNKSESFGKYRKEAKMIKEIQVEWTEKMQELQKEGFDTKDALNVKKDASKLKDLDYLKHQEIPGPFTSSEDVQAFAASNVDEAYKNQRLYIEVRYAKATCLSMNTKALNNFFKLRHKGKKLESKVYIECLKRYLDTSRSMAQVTIPDLQNTLGHLQQFMFNDLCESVSPPESNIHIGEHVAVFWIERNDQRNWYLGFIDNVNDDGIHVSHFIPSRKEKTEWTCPDEADIQIVEEEQILKRNISVSYLQTARIRCCIEQRIVDDVEDELQNLYISE